MHAPVVVLGLAARAFRPQRVGVVLATLAAIVELLELLQRARLVEGERALGRRQRACGSGSCESDTRHGELRIRIWKDRDTDKRLPPELVRALKKEDADPERLAAIDPRTGTKAQRRAAKGRANALAARVTREPPGVVAA